MKSFTLIELLLVVGILIILIAIAVPNFRSFQKETVLNNSTEEIIATLRLAQSKTLASERASQWGVYFETVTQPHQHTLFKGENYAARDSSFDETHKLPSAVEIYGIDLNGGNEAVFNRVTGTVNPSGSLSLRLKSDLTKTKTIYIEETGRVSLTSPSISSDTARLKDSRHLHFDLGWSIRDAITLKFQFVGPEPDQIETVSMTNYFNADKTEFNWDNRNDPFVVNGDNQIFQIHTHSLNSSNTLLCIHRDRTNGNNTEEVIIYIFDGVADRDIVHYLADVVDTAEQGSYVFNSMEKQ